MTNSQKIKDALKKASQVFIYSVPFGSENDGVYIKTSKAEILCLIKDKPEDYLNGMAEYMNLSENGNLYIN